ncbi:MinD/ParA family ATP-binding protein [Nocardia asiatica]|uniref:MinD/ParA family ATP-binding protein n=1 Tax=Nocardia asiatica TaxID=209252 RepID=UPI000684BE81|nr:hypothetical protein [Nocardia asiatica]
MAGNLPLGAFEVAAPPGSAHAQQKAWPPRSELAPAPPVLVAGVCGGAGVTTTVLGLASRLACASPALHTVAVDAVAGDLVSRGADARLLPATVQAWLADSDSPAALRLVETVSLASSGAGLLRCEPGPLPRRATLSTLCDRLIAERAVPVVDGGGSVSAMSLRPLLARPDLRIVVVIPARPDAATRTQVALQWLDAHLGGDLIAEATLVVSHQMPRTVAIAHQLRSQYTGWVARVLEVPFDPHLAKGTAITDAALSAYTRAAYTEIAQQLWPEHPLGMRSVAEVGDAR